MTFEKGDSVVFHDKHSDHDGETGEVTQRVDTMFDDYTYTVEFDDGETVANIGEGSLSEPSDE